MSETVKLQYRCKMCGLVFTEKVDASGLPKNTLALMRHIGLTKHNCPSGAVGIAELEGYLLND